MSNERFHSSFTPSSHFEHLRYVYIADSSNDRIIKWTTNYSAGGICVVGCSGTRGNAANQLRSPRDLKFDQYGNLYVSDQGNHRIQKFMIDVSSSSGCPNSKQMLFLASLSHSLRLFLAGR